MLRMPSALPDWTVGHVLTHIARNADGIRNMVEAAARGEVGMMYPGGVEQRNGDIEAGSGRTAAALAADVRSACAALDEAWSSLTDAAWADGVGRGPFGDRPVAALPFVRWREVQVHSLDLGIDAFGIDDLDPAYIDRELPAQEAAYRERSGKADLPAAAVALTPSRRLAWLIGRLAVPEAGEPGSWM
jgi:maleylpyruvate isomerase